MALLTRNDVLVQLQQIFPDHGSVVIENVLNHVGVLEGTNFTPDIINRCIDQLVQVKPGQHDQTLGLKTNDWGLLNDVQREVANQMKLIFPDFSNNLIKSTIKQTSSCMGPVEADELLQVCMDDMLEEREASNSIPVPTKDDGAAVGKKVNHKRQKRSRGAYTSNGTKTDYRDVEQFNSDDDSELMSALDETETFSDFVINSTSENTDKRATVKDADKPVEPNANNNNTFFYEEITSTMNNKDRESDALLHSNVKLSSTIDSSVSSSITSSTVAITGVTPDDSVLSEHKNLDVLGNGDGILKPGKSDQKSTESVELKTIMLSKVIETKQKEALKQAEIKPKETLKQAETEQREALKLAETKQKEALEATETKLWEAFKSIETKLKEANTKKEMMLDNIYKKIQERENVLSIRRSSSATAKTKERSTEMESPDKSLEGEISTSMNNKEGRGLLPSHGAMASKSAVEVSSNKNISPDTATSLSNSHPELVRGTTTHLGDSTIGGYSMKRTQDTLLGSVEKSDKVVNRGKSLNLPETYDISKHQALNEHFQKYRDRNSNIGAYKIPKLEKHDSPVGSTKEPSPQSVYLLQAGHNANPGSSVGIDETVSKHGDISETKNSTNLVESTSSVDKTFKSVFQEYRSHKKNPDKCSKLELSSDSSPDKDVLKDKSGDSDEESKLFSPTSLKAKDMNSSENRNERKRRYMLLDFSSDSDSDEGKSRDISFNKQENESLPDISFRTSTRERFTSPARKWLFGQRKTTNNLTSLIGTSLWRHSRDEEVLDQKFQPMNDPPYKLPQSRFVATGINANSPRSQKNSTSTNITESQNQDGFHQNKPATVLIESTTKITYSPESYKQDMDIDIGARPIPSLITHPPTVTVSFPITPSSQNNRLFNVHPPASATTTSIPSSHNNGNPSIDQSAATTSRHGLHTPPSTINNPRGVTSASWPTLSRQGTSDQHALPRTPPTLLTHKYDVHSNRYVPHTLPYSDVTPNSSTPSTLHINRSTVNFGASASKSFITPINTLNTEGKSAVQTPPDSSTVFKADQKEMFGVKGNSEEADDDDEISVTLFEPAAQILVPDSPVGMQPILDINTEPMIIDEVIVPYLEDEDMANPRHMRNEERQPLPANVVRVERPPAADVNAGQVETPVIVVETKTPEQVTEELKNEVLKLFPEVDPPYLDELCRTHTEAMALNNICFLLFENEYPRVKQNTDSDPVEPKKVPSVDYFKHNQFLTLDRRKQTNYAAESHLVLTAQFPTISAADIRKVFNAVHFSYASAYRVLQDVYKQALEKVKKDVDEGKRTRLKGLVLNATIEIDSTTSAMVFRMLKTRRVASAPSPYLPELQAELDFVKVKMDEMATERDHQLALQLNEQEYEDEGQCIECGCCYGEIPFDNMVQCLDGHLFCEDCLRQYAKESVFGQGKAQLLCMTDGCKSAFPKNQLEKALPSEVLLRYEDRVAEESLNLADIGDLVRCPHCDYAAIMDPGARVFTCMNDKCNKETCRHCKEDWSEHFGKTCEEIEKKDEVKLRLVYEEKMTKAKVRTCHRCKAQFTKDDGCNKMTCRCGGKMCYICRKPNIDYNHFCQHPRDPGKICTSCEACSLWTNPEEDDNRAVAEIQKEAAEVRKNKGYSDEKVIGVPEPPKKKQKK